MGSVIVCADTGERCSSYGVYLTSRHWRDLRRRYFASNLSKTCLAPKCKERAVDLHT